MVYFLPPLLALAFYMAMGIHFMELKRRKKLDWIIMLVGFFYVVWMLWMALARQLC